MTLFPTSMTPVVPSHCPVRGTFGNTSVCWLSNPPFRIRGPSCVVSGEGGTNGSHDEELVEKGHH